MAESNGLESFEWKRYPWTSRVVRTEDGAGGGDITDRETESSNSHGRCDGLLGELPRRAGSELASRVAQWLPRA